MNKKILTIFVIGLVGLPMAAAASTLQNQGVVTGHTTYANMGGFDPNIAAIAGLAESKVVWFNGQTIFSTTGDGFVYAASADAPCSPLDGKEYEFQDYNLSYIDPNNISHIVAHYTFQCGVNLFSGDLGTTQNGVERTVLNGSADRHHVWVTVTHAKKHDGPITIQGTGGEIGDDGRLYNFALAVDTKFFRDTSEDGSVGHDGGGGRTTDDINEGNSYCEQDTAMGDHVCNEGSVDGEDTPHVHNSAQVDLYFSKGDKGIGVDKKGGGTHPGTAAGCSTDAHCSAILTGTYEDPTATSP